MQMPELNGSNTNPVTIVYNNYLKKKNQYITVLLTSLRYCF